MKKMIVAAIMLVMSASICQADSAMGAVRALNKLEARCEAGISPRDYGAALGDAVFEVKMYLKSKEAKEGGKLKELIVMTIDNYKKAGENMQAGIDISYGLQRFDKNATATDIKTEYDEIVATYFRAASYGLRHIDEILNK